MKGTAIHAVCVRKLKAPAVKRKIFATVKNHLS